MQTVGVICEYNPFHLGHAHQLAMIRQQLGGDAAVVCLMSGNYVQRGEPAVFDKGVRARAAVDAGADLVLELPVMLAVMLILTVPALCKGKLNLSLIHISEPTRPY